MSDLTGPEKLKLERTLVMGDGFVLAFDVNPIVTTGNRDPQRVANLAQMLIASTEER